MAKDSETSAPASAQTFAEAFSAASTVIKPAETIDETVAQLAEQIMRGFDLESIKEGAGVIAQLVADIEYEGFDAMAMARRIVKTARQMEPKNHLLPIANLLAMYVKRGGNSLKIIQDAKGVSRGKVTNLLSQFQVKPTPDPANKKETVTLPRLAICFASMACQLASQIKPVNQIFPGREGIRHPLRLPCFPALIPEDATNNEKLLFAASLYFNTRQSLIWNRRAGEAMKVAHLEEQLQWANLARSSSILTTTERREALKKCLGGVVEPTAQEQELVNQLNQLHPNLGI